MQDPPLSDSLAGDAVPPNPPDNVVVSRSSHESAPNNQKVTPKTAATSGAVPNLLLKLLEGSPDEGGNLPSDIWLSVGGSEVFGQWMKDVCEW
jgi:dihydrofolate reductase